MKKIMIALVALMTFIIPANAMSYEQAREQALFLTDKMAYELNLTEDQYEAAYEVNLDYLMSISTYDDLYGVYWRNRNLDMSYILLDWQYNAFCAASYFYRPLYWSAGAWHFGIYARYPHRTYLYFGRPHFYVSYTGGHSWRMNGGRSWYHGRSYGEPHRRATNNHGPGMKDGFHRGDYNDRNHGTNHGADRHGDRGRDNRGGDNRNHNNNGVGNHGNGGYNHGNNGNDGVRPSNDGGRPGDQNGVRPSNRNNDNGGFRGNRNSSTRTTAPGDRVNNNRTGVNGGNRGSVSTTPSNRFTPERSSRSVAPQRNNVTRSSSSNAGFSGGSSSRGSSMSHNSGSSSRGGSVSSGSHGGGGSRGGGGGHFGGRR